MFPLSSTSGLQPKQHSSLQESLRLMWCFFQRMHSVRLSLGIGFIVVGWLLFFVQGYGAGKTAHMVRVFLTFAAQYGYILVVTLLVLFAISILYFELAGVRNNSTVDDERLDILEKQHPYLPTAKQMLLALLFALSFPLFFWTLLLKTQAFLLAQSAPLLLGIRKKLSDALPEVSPFSHPEEPSIPSIGTALQFIAKDMWMALLRNARVRFGLMGLFVCIGWLLFAVQSAGIGNAQRLIRHAIAILIAYGYITFLVLCVIAAVCILIIELRGMVNMMHVEEESLDVIEYTHPYLPSYKQIFVTLALATSLPFLFWGAVVNASVTIEALSPISMYSYEEARSWQIANDAGGTVNIWTNGGGTNNWSTPGNWSLGNVPTPAQIAYFGSTGTASATVDSSFGGTISELKVAPGYTGTITLGRNLNVNGQVILSGGTLDVSASNYAISATGSWLNYGNNHFTARSGTVTLAGTGSHALSGSTFYNLKVNNGLLSYWKLDEGMGSVAKDLSGNGNNGTLNNAPAWSTDVSSRMQFYNPNSLSFDGTNDYVSIADADTFDFGTRNFSFSTWVKTSVKSQDTAFRRIIDRGFSVAGWGVYIDGTTGSLGIIIDNTVGSANGTDIANNAWHHVGIAITRNASAVFYLDGSPYGTPVNVSIEATTVLNNALPVTIGAYSVTPSQGRWNGLIDDVRIYSRALSRSEVIALYNGNQSTGSGTYTLGSALTVAGNLNIHSGTLDASASNYGVNLAGNLLNAGGFTKQSGTVTLDGAGNQTLSGSTVFHALSAITSTARTIFFDYTGRQSASGSLTLRGVSGNKLSIRSTKSGSGAHILLDGDVTQAATDVEYLDVKDSDATGGQALVCYTNTEGCTDSGNNTNWTLGSQTFSITGKVYSNTGATTPLTGVTVAASLNGGVSAGSAAVDAGGQFTISSLTFTGGTIITLYIDGATQKAVTVTTGSGTSTMGATMTGMTLIQNNLIIRSGTGTHVRVGSPITSNNLNTANNNGDTDITAVFTNSSDNITATGKRVYVWTGSALNLGGTITAGHVHINGNMSQGANTMTLAGNLTMSGGTFTGGSATIDTTGSFILGGGTFLSTSSSFTDNGDWIHASPATFLHNNGSVLMRGAANTIMDIPTVETFFHLQMNHQHAIITTIASGDRLVTLGTLTLTNGKFTGGAIEAYGDIVAGPTYDGATSTTTLTLLGTADQLFAGTQVSTGEMGPILVNKPSGTVNSTGTIYTSSGFTLLSGTFIAPQVFGVGANWTHTAGGTFTHNSGSVILSGAAAASIDVLTSETFYDLQINASNVARTIATGDTLVTLNTLTLTNGSFAGGTLDTYGNVTIGASYDTSSTSALRFRGSADQTFTDATAGSTPSGTYTINKTAGKVRLASAFRPNASGQDLILSGGTLDLNGYNLTVNDIFTVGTGTTLRLHGGETITGGPDFLHRNSTVWYDESAQTNILKTMKYQNLVISSTGSGIFRPKTTGQSIGNNLFLSGGTLQVNGGQPLSVSGAWVQTGGTFTAGTGTVMLAGTGTTQTLKATSSFNNLSVNNGLVAYWKLDEGTGTVAKDVSGNANTATLISGPTWSTDTPSALQFNNPKSLRFDGVNDYVSGGAGSSLNVTGDLTLSVWAKYGQQGAGFARGLVSKDYTTSYFFGVAGGGTAVSFWAAGSERVAATPAVSNVWNHIVLRYDRSTAKIFINGTQAGTAAYSTPLASDPSTNTVLGRHGGYVGSEYVGYLDDVRIYNRALSTSEITALYNGNQSTGSGTYTLGSALTVAGNLNIHSGTIDVTSSNYGVNFAGNLLNAGGFTKQSGTVTLNGSGNQTLSGSTVFHALTATTSTARTIFFDYTGRQSASGSLTLQGIAGNLLSLRSTRSGSGARILLDGDVTQATTDIRYLNVQDSDATGGQTLVCYSNTEGCTDSGNNTNWTLTGDAVTGTGTLKGFVWNDSNGNGVRDSSEITGLNAITASLTGTTATGGVMNRTTATNSLGLYFFSGATISNNAGYTVTLNSNVTPTGYLKTRFNSSGSNVLGTGAVININFGYLVPSTLSGSVFIDTDKNGVKDAGEANGLNGVSITLGGTSGTGGIVSGSTVTSGFGDYLFSGLPTSSLYTASIISGIPTGYIATRGTSSGVAITIGGTAQQNVNLGYYWYATMTGAVFVDSNANGIKDAGETSGVSNVGVSLTGTTSTGASITKSATSTSTGAFIFPALPLSSGNYTTTITVPSGYTLTSSNDLTRTITAGSIPPSLLFGLKAVTATGTVKGTAWNDENGNGVKDSSETTGLSSLAAALTGTTGTGMSLSRNTTTNSNGQFFFSGALLSNSAGYTVTLNSNVTPTGYLMTRFNSSGSNVLGTGAVIDIKFGYVLQSTLAGSVFVDTNKNGIKDFGESSELISVGLTLGGTSGTGGIVAASTTTGFGGYTFSGLPTSTLFTTSVVSGIPNGYVASRGTSSGVAITVGGSSKTVNFGYYWYATMTGAVFLDANANGVRDGAETSGVSGVTVALGGTTSTGSSITKTALSTGTGAFTFVSMPLSSGNYTTTITVPSGYTLTSSNGLTRTITAGVIPPSMLFGLKPITATGTVKGTAWNDENGNGVKDSSETTGLSSLAAALTGTTGTGMSLSRNTTTSTNGQFFFSGALLSNSAGYTVTLNSNVTPTGYLMTRFNSSGSNVLGTGAVIDIKFGYVQPNTLSGSVFIDGDSDNQKDSGETAFSGSVLSLTGTSGTGGTVNITTTSNASGTYVFRSLPTSATTFVLAITPPTGYTVSTSNSRNISFGTGGQIKLEHFAYTLTPVASSSSSSAASSVTSDTPSTGTDTGGGCRGSCSLGVIAITPVVPGGSSSVPAEQQRESPDDTIADDSPTDTAPDTDQQVVQDTPVSSPILHGITPRIATDLIIPDTTAYQVVVTQILNSLSAAGDLITSAVHVLNAEINTGVDAIAEWSLRGIAVVADGVTWSIDAVATLGQRTVNTVGQVADALNAGISTLTNRAIAFINQTGNVLESGVTRMAQRMGVAGDMFLSVSRTVGSGISETVTQASALGQLAYMRIGSLYNTAEDMETILVMRAGQSVVQLALQTQKIGTDTWQSFDVAERSFGIVIADMAMRYDDTPEYVERVASAIAAAVQKPMNAAADTVSQTAIALYEAASHGVNTMGDTLRQVAFDFFPAGSPDMAPPVLPPAEKYRTVLRKENDKILIASLTMSVFDSFGVPYANTPVVLFSTPKIAVTSSGGIATFHDVETGRHQIEIHVKGGNVEKRDFILEPPSTFTPLEEENLEVVLPVIQVMIAEPVHGAASSNGMPMYAWVIIGLLIASNGAWVGMVIVRKRGRN